ncbi:MAG: hypothetical protein QGI50_11430 [Dehalococcoidia bacterium]|nr:hypothetical protein [Dehalococcoidia bacterium]
MATRVTPEVATLRREVQDKYTEVATYPERTFHFHHGRPLAELLACWQPAQMGQFGTREIRGVEELG